MEKNIPVVGQNELVSFGRRAIDVPAKIDTGADGSAIWASKIRVDKNGILKFALFGEGSPYYNGKVFKRKDYEVASVKNSSGVSEVRYRTYFNISVGGRKIKVKFSLADRSKNGFPVLIGRRTINGKFLVDVSKKAAGFKKPKKTIDLNKELQKNPYQFHKKYVRKGV